MVRAGLALFEDLSQPTARDVLLMTDLHAGNVLAARREPWLAIDPKPFVGDAAYDATQHLLNSKQRVLANLATIDHFADLLSLEAERVRAWLFARAAAEPCDSGDAAAQMLALARALSNRVT
jgi:streptomycin 6-kinase